MVFKNLESASQAVEDCMPEASQATQDAYAVQLYCASMNASALNRVADAINSFTLEFSARKQDD